MIKHVRIPVNDILFDPEEISGMLTDCMHRRRKMRLLGACQCNDVLIVSFEETAVDSNNQIVLAPIRGNGPDAVAAEISERYEHGFMICASFQAGDQLWALFKSTADAEE